MLKYCFLLDDKSGLVQLGVGCDDAYYIEIGMLQRDVEQSEKDNNWYLTEKCPHYTEEEKINLRKSNFESEFFNIEGYGWYRKVPKGYQSAVESMTVLYTAANIYNGIQSGLIIFYQQQNLQRMK